MPPCCATVKPVALPISLPNSYSFGHISGRQIAEKLADPADRVGDRLAAVRVGKSEIAFAERAEARAGHRRDTCIVEKLALQRAGIEARVRHIGENVEGATWPRTAKPGQAVQRGNNRRAALGKRGDHA